MWLVQVSGGRIHEPKQAKRFQLSLSRGGSPYDRIRGIGFDNTWCPQNGLYASRTMPYLSFLLKRQGSFSTPRWMGFPHLGSKKVGSSDYPTPSRQVLHDYSTKYLTIR